MADELHPDRESDPPADVSDQNREEPSAPHRPPAGEGRRSDEADTADSHERPQRGAEAGRGTPGGAGEGSQATGHPDNAG